jgi:hypothetical protein
MLFGSKQAVAVCKANVYILKLAVAVCEAKVSKKV